MATQGSRTINSAEKTAITFFINCLRSQVSAAYVGTKTCQSHRKKTSITWKKIKCGVINNSCPRRGNGWRGRRRKRGEQHKQLAIRREENIKINLFRNNMKNWKAMKLNAAGTAVGTRVRLEGDLALFEGSAVELAESNEEFSCWTDWGGLEDLIISEWIQFNLKIC